MPTAQVAREQYVTPKTIEGHLTNIYRKIDMHGRDQLAALLELAA